MMYDWASRYHAINRIAEYGVGSGATDAVLRKMLSAAESVLSETPLVLLLSRGGEYIRILPGNGSKVGRGLEEAMTDSACSRMLSASRSSLVTYSKNGTHSKAWVVPLSGSFDGQAALVSCTDGLAKEDKEFLDLVARHLSLYLQSRGHDSQQLPSGLEKRIAEISAMYEISQAVQTLPIGDLLKKVTKTAAQVMDAEACSLMLKDPNKAELVIRASYGLSEKIVEEARVPYGKGVAGQVAQTGEPMLINDLGDDPRFAKGGVRPRPGIASSICVPLTDEEGGVQGVLSVRRRAPALPFTEDDIKLFSVFAGQASLAISNAHLYASLKDSVQELSTLYDASRELSSAYSVENTGRALVRLASDMLGGCAATLLLLDARHQVRVQASSGTQEGLWDRISALIDDNAISWARSLREPRSLIIGNQSRWPSQIRPVEGLLEGVYGRVILVPLVSEDDLNGMLILGIQDKKPVEQQKIRLVSIAASQAATIIKNAAWHETQMEQKVLELTALYQLSERISTAASLTEALDSILDIVRDIVWYDESFIATADYERNIMSVQACRGIACEEMRRAEIPLDEDGLMSWAIRERKALVSPDISKDPRFAQPQVSGGTIRSLMAIPLIVHDEVVGVLSVHGYAPNLYTEDNVRVLSVIASQAAALYKELEALSALANYTDNILRSIAAGVLTLDQDGKVLTWNKAAEEVLSIPATKAVDKHFSEVVDMIGISAEDKAVILNAVTWVMMTGENYVGYKQQYHPLDREPLYINMSISQLRDHLGGMLGLVIIFEDVTKEVQMENEMRRISELAAVGQLAASIAHEIRNPLSSIKGAAQFLRNEYGDHDALCEFLDIIVEEVNVLNKITTEFLDFARPLKLNLKEIDINDVIFRTLQFMQLEIAKQKVELDEQLAYDTPKIQADDKQLEQVLRNIILNALQAMPKGGRLGIISEPLANGVRVRLTDTGVGMSPDTVSQIFVPFFTTRTKGTGLGLSIVHKIIENHGGKVSVESALGQGTTFEIYLPICGDKARSAIIHTDSAADSDGSGLFRRGRSEP